MDRIVRKKPNIGIILLAAGASERMQKNKLLLNIGGTTLLENAMDAVQKSSVNSTILVLGANKEENLKVLEKYSVVAVVNTNWKNGIGSSIKYGLQKTLETYPKTDAVIVSVCDQPFLGTEILDGLIHTYTETGKKIVASAYRQSIGVPVLYDRIFFNDLLKIPDGYGAKKFVIEKADEDIIATFPFPKGEIDIDTEEDLRNLPWPKDRGN